MCTPVCMKGVHCVVKLSLIISVREQTHLILYFSHKTSGWQMNTELFAFVMLNEQYLYYTYFNLLVIINNNLGDMHKYNPQTNNVYIKK